MSQNLTDAASGCEGTLGTDSPGWVWTLARGCLAGAALPSTIDDRILAGR